MQVKKKEFTYRGKTLEELKNLEVREFAKLLASKQRRYVLRQFQEIEKFINRSKKKQEKGKSIKTHRRDLVIVPGLIGMKIQIYDGRKFVGIEVVGEMLGHKFGEFSPTRSKVSHGSAGVGATKGSKAKSKK